MMRRPWSNPDHSAQPVSTRWCTKGQSSGGYSSHQPRSRRPALPVLRLRRRGARTERLRSAARRRIVPCERADQVAVDRIVAERYDFSNPWASTPGGLVQERSSVGRAAVSKTAGRGFESCRSCHSPPRAVARPGYPSMSCGTFPPGGRDRLGPAENLAPRRGS